MAGSLTLCIGGVFIVLQEALLLCPLLEPRDISWIHWAPPKAEASLLVFALSSALDGDHCRVLARAGVLGVEVPLFKLRLVLFLSFDGVCVSSRPVARDGAQAAAVSTYVALKLY